MVVTIEVPVASEQEWFRSECNRILRPGGRVVVTMYNSASYKGWLTKARRLTTRQMPVWGEHYYVSSITRQRQQWLQDGFIAEGAAGFYWLPFSRDADGRVIPLAAAIERTLSFLLPLRWSPWAAYCFGKPDNRTMASAE